MSGRCVWKVAPLQDELRKELAGKLDIPEIIAQILINRGVSTVEDAIYFLGAGLDRLVDPGRMKDMDRALDRVVRAIQQQEKIVIYGDYDVDGITATSLLYRVLTSLGAKAAYYIPERFGEGYGLNDAALEKLHGDGAQLVITVDCGISAIAEVEKARHFYDIIITDHHEPGEMLPNAHSILNPKRQDCFFPHKQLAGVGVAFKLCQGLWQRLDKPTAELYTYLDLVAVGTVADVVPLLGENRILVKEGLKRIAATANTGLKALLRVSGIEGKVSVGNIGFGIGPRINASGRLSHALSAVELLTTQDEERAASLAQHLETENLARRQIEENIRLQADTIVAQMDLAAEKVLVVAGEHWHHGVIGIAASRILEKYYRPTVMISLEDGMGRGSCRSIKGFNMFEALNSCRDILLKFGGHAAAAGFSILPENIGELRRRLNARANQVLTEEDYLPVVAIDIPVQLNDISLAFIEKLNILAPFGPGNPAPVLACRDMVITDVRVLGKDKKHLKLRVLHNQCAGEIVFWNKGELAASLPMNSSIAATFFPEINEWQGQARVQLHATDIKRQGNR